jgi:hypothetical protein
MNINELNKLASLFVKISEDYLSILFEQFKLYKLYINYYKELIPDIIKNNILTVENVIRSLLTQDGKWINDSKKIDYSLKSIMTPFAHKEIIKEINLPDNIKKAINSTYEIFFNAFIRNFVYNV